jgi:hypothetical protein
MTLCDRYPARCAFHNKVASGQDPVITAVIIGALYEE